jgi:hypothetical protein
MSRRDLAFAHGIEHLQRIGFGYGVNLCKLWLAVCEHFFFQG